MVPKRGRGETARSGPRSEAAALTAAGMEVDIWRVPLAALRATVEAAARIAKLILVINRARHASYVGGSARPRPIRATICALPIGTSFTSHLWGMPTPRTGPSRPRSNHACGPPPACCSGVTQRPRGVHVCVFVVPFSDNQCLCSLIPGRHRAPCCLLSLCDGATEPRPRRG